jgi:hypothetical protein
MYDVGMKQILQQATEAAWEHPDQTLPRRWWLAAKATHNGLAATRLGFLMFPHTIRLYASCW